MLNIIQKLVPESKYSRKCPYKMTPGCVIIHNTANDASAENEIKYMTNNDKEISFHFAVDDEKAVQGIPETRNSWNAGDGKSGSGNRTGIAIEICYSKSGGQRFVKAKQNAAELAAHLLRKYGWGIGHLKKHQDFNGKYCPHRTLDMGWNRFVEMVQKHLTGTVQAAPETPEHLYRVRKAWTEARSQIGAYRDLNNAKNACVPGYKVFDGNGNVVYRPGEAAFEPYTVRTTCNVLNIRKEPTTDSAVVGRIADKKRYTIVEERTGKGSSKGWGKLKSGAGWVSLDWVEKV